jgi:hypothetical protein
LCPLVLIRSDKGSVHLVEEPETKKKKKQMSLEKVALLAKSHRAVRIDAVGRHYDVKELMILLFRK